MKRSFLKAMLIVFVEFGLINLGCADENLVAKTGKVRPYGVQMPGDPAQDLAGRDSATSSYRKMPDAVYTIDAAEIALWCGASGETLPGSSSKIVTSYSGNEVCGDSNHHGKEDIAFAHDFPGEADPNLMTLDMKTWIWAYTAYADGNRVEPKTVGSFGLTFYPNGRVLVRTDCNSMAGSYSEKEGKLIFLDFAATKMYCEGSQEADFSRMLAEVSRFFFNSRSELIVGFKYDSGSMIFK